MSNITAAVPGQSNATEAGDVISYMSGDSNDTTTRGTIENVVTTTLPPEGLNTTHIGIIVGVLIGVLLITAVVLFILFRKKRKAPSQSKQQSAGGVYEPTTAPLDEESRMLKDAPDQTEMQEKKSSEENGTKKEMSEDSPLKETPPVADQE